MGIEASISETTGTVSSHTPAVSSPEESDGVIVPGKLANKGMLILAEPMEERPPTERKATTAARLRSQNRLVLSIGSRWLRMAALENPSRTHQRLETPRRKRASAGNRIHGIGGMASRPLMGNEPSLVKQNAETLVSQQGKGFLW